MVKDTIRTGIHFLKKQQLNSGRFISYSSPDPLDFTKAKELPSIFPTALILQSMNNLPDYPELITMKLKAANYLLSQKSAAWSFNYWQRKSKIKKEMQYPDDLDDTTCSLAALYKFDESLLDGNAFANIISLLTAVEIEEGGPYRTWLVSENSPDNWKDIDVAVNANIGYFLSLQEIELPNINKFIEEAIRSKKLISPYYNTDLPIIYFISRWYKGDYKENLIKYLLNKRVSIEKIPLLQAFFVLSVLHLTSSIDLVENEIGSLISKQKKGVWDPFGFYIDPVIDGKKHFAGSQAITSAYCILAISQYDKLREEIVQKKQIRKISNEEKMATKIIEYTKKRFEKIGSPLNDNSHKMISEINAGAMGNQVTLLPYITTKCLKQHNKEIPERLLIDLGSANLLGWLAYTIYDDFLDEEGEPKNIPIANIALRELVSLFSKVIPKNTEFIHLFTEIMDSMDHTNSWEIANCRIILTDNKFNLDNIKLPDYGNYKYLANRSMGHALCSVALLYYLGYKTNSLEVQYLLKFFYHYIIAKQLNDDAHDVVEDLKKGHINAVSARVLAAIKLKRPKYQPKKVSKLLELVQEIFLKETVLLTSNDILKHVTKARKALNDNPIFERKELLESLLNTPEAAAKKALREHAKVKEFLNVYQ